MTIIDAIKSLKPNSEWVVRGDYTYENLEWLDKSQTKPTKAELEAEVTRLETEYDKNAYQ